MQFSFPTLSHQTHGNNVRSDIRSASEKVLYVPNCYQVNDSRRQIAETPTRRECGLPETGFVFCSFNINFKIPHSTGGNGPSGTQFSYMDVGLNTSGDFKEGQKAVLGKVGLDDDSAVFVVVALKVLD